MTQTASSGADPLRVSDLVPLRRMLGTDSVVIRVNPDGTIGPIERAPAVYFDPSMRRALSGDLAQQFGAACRRAVEDRATHAFRPPGPDTVDEIMINPILDDTGETCRFLVCWARRTHVIRDHRSSLSWSDLVLDDIVVRYRWIVDRAGSGVVEASPWWALARGEFLELWPHHAHITALGLGQAVMEHLIHRTAEAAVAHHGGPAVRVAVPSADLLAGLVPTFHGMMRASGLPAARVIVAVPVELAVDPDLLPVIVHLRTMGLQIDIVGLDALTATLHRVSDTSNHAHDVRPGASERCGAWVDGFEVAAAGLEPDPR